MRQEITDLQEITNKSNSKDKVQMVRDIQKENLAIYLPSQMCFLTLPVVKCRTAMFRHAHYRLPKKKIEKDLFYQVVPLLSPNIILFLFFLYLNVQKDTALWF